MVPEPTENTPGYWSSHAKFYENSTHDLLFAPGASLLEELDSMLPFSPRDLAQAQSDVYVLDDGAGSGNQSLILKGRHPQLRLLATDLSPGMLETLRDKAAQHTEWSSIEMRVSDAQDLSQANLTDSMFSHVVSAFMIYFCQDPPKAVSEMYRVLRPGGVVGIATITDPSPSWRLVWQLTVRDYFSRKEHYDANRVGYESPIPFPLVTYEQDQMRKMMTDAGFDDVKLRTFDAYFAKQTIDESVEWFYQMARQNPGLNVFFKDFTDDEIDAMRPTFRQKFLGLYGETNENQYEKMLLTTARKPEKEA